MGKNTDENNKAKAAEEVAEELNFDDIEQLTGGSMKNIVKNQTQDISSSMQDRA